jgi:hypothetical protein
MCKIEYLSRHPLVITIISFILGGLCLFYLQNKVNETKTLRDRRIAVIEDVMKFSAISQSTYRTLDRLSGDFSNASLTRFDEIQDKVQGSIEDSYYLGHMLTLELKMYFGETDIPEKYFEVLSAYSIKVNSTIEEMRASNGKRGSISQNDFDHLAESLSDIIFNLNKKMGFGNYGKRVGKFEI